MIRAVWNCRWPVVRLALAASLLGTMWSDNASRIARLQYASLPDIDVGAYAGELRQAGQFDDAMAVLDAAIADSKCGPGESGLAKLTAMREAIRAERDGFWRRAGLVGAGALCGTGDSPEALAGAIAADLFVFGDIRDLAIQGGRLATDGECDELVTILSGIGLATTISPGDIAPAFLKVAHKAGCLTRGFIEGLADLGRGALRGGQRERLVRVAADLRSVIGGSSASIAARAMRHVDDPAELARLADFVRKHPSGGFAIHMTGKEGVRLICASGDVKGAAKGIEEAVLLAAMKGPRGGAWLRSGAYRVMRPHPLVGAAKAWSKGNLERAASAFTSRYLDPWGWLLIPTAAAWVVLEAAIIARRLARGWASRGTSSSRAKEVPGFRASPCSRV